MLAGSRKLVLSAVEEIAGKSILNQFVAAANTPSRRQALRLLFVRHSYFRQWPKIPILIAYWVTGLEGREPDLNASAEYAQKNADIHIAAALEQLRPFLQSRFIGPFVSAIYQRIKKKKIRKEETIQSEIFLGVIARFKENLITDTISDAMKELGEEALPLAALLGRSVIGSVARSIAQKSKLIDGELGLTGMSASEFYSSMIEMGVLKPLGTLLWCLNPTCLHWEVLVTNRLLRHERCPKCNEPAFSSLALVMEPELTNLKLRDRDLSSFLALLANRHSRMELVEGALVTSIQAFANATVTASGRDPREVDLLLYSPLTGKCCAVECKVHEDSHKILPGTWESVCIADLRQLHDILSKTGIKQGAYVTSLRLTDDQVQTIRDSILPKVGLKSETTLIIPFAEEPSFLNGVEELLRRVDPKASLSGTPSS